MMKAMIAGAAAVVAFASGAHSCSPAELANELGKCFLPRASDMLTFTVISQKLHEMDMDADAAWMKLSSRAEYDAYRKRMHEKMMAAMGDWPDRTPLNARTMATIKRDGYRIEKLVFESMPGLYVTANLFVPESAKFKAPYPAVVMSCGHSAEGKDSDIYMRSCVIAVRNGFAVLMYDPYEQGERRQYGDIGSTKNHNIIGLKASLLGWSMPMLRVWDGMRAIDYAMSRSEVDPSRIGFMGQSGGGTMTALMTAADWRLKATAPSCYLTSLRHLCESMGPQDAEQNIYGQLAFGLNHTGYVLMPDIKVAVTCKFRDMFSIYGTLDLFRTVRGVSAMLGVQDHYALNSAPGPHGWTECTQTASIDWMRAWLKGERDVLPLDCQKYRLLDIGFVLADAELGLGPEERGVTPTKRTMDIPGARDIHAILRERFASVAGRRPSRSSAERNAIAVRLAGVRMPSETRSVVKVLPETDIGGAKLARVAFVYPDGLELPACWIAPATPDPSKPPVMMTGANGRAAWADEALACLAGGASVLVADITGYGEIGKPNAIFYGANECPEEGVSAMLYLMGETMTGHRATDMLVAARWIKEKTGLAPELRAYGSAAIPAAHARAADPSAFSRVSVRDQPMSWREFIEKGDTVQYRYAYTVPGALLHYDWPELLD